MPPKIATTLKQSNEHEVVNTPRKISKDTPGNARDSRESSITQVLSQRLGNMEQQLVLLRGDLKAAVETLKRKDQEITTLENKIALAERRRDAEKNGGSPDEDLRDLSEDVDPQSKSKQELLQKECDTLAQKLQEMEKFFGDYGLAWVKEDAIDEKDPNNLWVRKTNIHYTPDFDKIVLVVEELNVGNAEPQIVKTGNTAQFKTADLLNLTLYADGIQLENNPFRLYDSPSVEEFFRDLEDGYFPSELKGKHPEGVIFKVKDMRNTKFADDPNRRPAVRRSQNTTSSPRRMSTSSVSRGPQKSPTGKDVKSESEKDPNMVACRTPRRSRTLSRKGSTSSRRSIMKNVAAKPTEAPKVADGKMQPQVSATPAANDNVELDGGIKLAPSEGLGNPKVSPGGMDGPDKIIPGNDGTVPKNEPRAERTETEGGTIAGADGINNKEGVADGAKPSPGTGTGNGVDTDNTKSVPNTTDTGLKQLFVAGKSPQISSTRVPQPLATNDQKIELDKELTKDSFGLPRPPLSTSASDRSKDLPKPIGPPSKHFDNYFLNKAEETQTSGTYVNAQAPQTQPPPTHITNITYNEAPITIQMTPSELKGGERKTPTALNICPIHHPHPCDCAHGPPPSDTPEEDGGIGPIGLIRIPGETEYREKYTEGAVNSTNVLQQKKKSQEQEKKRSHEKPPILVAQDVAPIPPDPVQMGTAFDPNLQWPNFVYFGHPKGQEASPPPPTPVSPPFSAKKKLDSPQIIQLNEKTSDRMISVKMRTKSGSKEYVAHLYPEESAKRLRSLLNMNDGDTLIIENGRKVVTENTNVAEISTESGQRVVVSRFGDKKPKKQYYPERPNLGSRNPDLFKNYPGEIEVKKKKKRKKPDEKKEVSVGSVSSDSFSLKREKNEDDNESRDLVISQYENRDWLSKEVYSRRDVPRVSSNELKLLLNELKVRAKKGGDISITTVSDMNTIQTTGNNSDLPPKIVSEDAVSVEPLKGQKANYSSRIQKGLGTEKHEEIIDRPTVVPTGEKSRSSSMISESQCHVNSFVAEPRKKLDRKNIHESSSSLNVVEMDRAFPERVSAGPFGGGEHGKHKSRDSSDVLTERGNEVSHSLIFRRRSSVASSDVAEKESSHSGLKIESMDTNPRTSKTSFSYSWSRNLKSDVNFTDHITSIKTGDGGTPPKAADTGFDHEKELSNRIGDDLSNREFSDEKRQNPRCASSSGIRGDGFETATLLEMVEAMLRAQKEHEKDKLRKMKRDGVLIRRNSYSDVSMSTEFVPPVDVVQELEELRKSLGEVSHGSPPQNQYDESDREFAERLLEEILSRKSSPDEVIRKLEARRNGSTTMREAVPEVSPKPITMENRRGRMKKSPTKSRRKRHKEFNANVYPEEPVKKLWSLLKLNDKEYSLTSTQAPHKPLKRGSIGEHSRDNDLSLVLSKTKTNNVPMIKETTSVSSTNDQPTKIKSDVKTPSTEGIPKKSRSPKIELGTSSREGLSHISNPPTKAKTELTTTSKEGSNIANVNININIDSHTSHGERAQVNKVDQTKQEPLSPEKQKTAKKVESRSDRVSNQMIHPPPKLKDRLSQLELPITPKTRAKALSEHLSQSSLHRKSFQSISYRDSPIKGTVQLEPAWLHKEGPDEGNSKGNRRTTGSKEFTRTSPNSSTGRVPDKVDSSKNLSKNLKGGVPTSKEDIYSVTNNKPKTIPSSQSFKGLDKKTSSKSSLINKRISVSKLSLEKKGRKGSSKLLIAEGGKETDTLVNKPSRSSSQSPVLPTDIKFEIHSPTSPSLEQEKRVDQGPPAIDVNSGRKSSKGSTQKNSFSVDQPGDGVSGIQTSHTGQDRDSHSAGGLTGPNEKQSSVSSHGKDAFSAKKSNSPGREPTRSHEENKVDPNPLGTTLERRVSNNEGMSLETNDTALSPGKGMSHTADKPLSPEQHRMETDAHRRSPEREIVTPVVKEIVHNFLQDTWMSDSAADDTSSKPNGAGDSPGTSEQKTHSMEDTEGRKKLSSPEKQQATNVDDHSQLSGADPQISGEKAATPLKEVDDVVQAEVKAPNADPPHINLSDADLSDEKEAKLLSVNHDHEHEYDKHDSEQEFKREIPTNITTVNTNVGNEEDRKQPEEKMDKREEKKIDKSKTKTSKGSSKNNKRKSPEIEDDRTEKHGNSQEHDKSDGNREENVNMTSPVISKENIAPDNTEAQNADDTSESSLT